MQIDIGVQKYLVNWNRPFLLWKSRHMNPVDGWYYSLWSSACKQATATKQAEPHRSHRNDKCWQKTLAKKRKAENNAAKAQ